MKIKHKWDSDFRGDPMVFDGVGDAIEHAVDSAPNMYDGEYASLRAKVNVLKQALALMAEMLPPAKQVELIEALDLGEIVGG